MSIDMVDHSIVLFLEWNVLASLFTHAIKCSEIVFSIRCVNLWLDELCFFIVMVFSIRWVNLWIDEVCFFIVMCVQYLDVLMSYAGLI